MVTIVILYPLLITGATQASEQVSDNNSLYGSDVMLPEDSVISWNFEYYLENQYHLENPKKPLPIRRIYTVSYDPCSCVSTARALTGINVGPIGLAKNHPINTDTPIIGGIVITTESYAGHLATVTGIDENYIYVTDGNYVPCAVTKRKIKRDDPVIRGYFWQHTP